MADKKTSFQPPPVPDLKVLEAKQSRFPKPRASVSVSPIIEQVDGVTPGGSATHNAVLADPAVVQSTDHTGIVDPPSIAGGTLDVGPTTDVSGSDQVHAPGPVVVPVDGKVARRLAPSPSRDTRDPKKPSPRTVARIDLDLVDESPYQNRAKRDENYIADLAENIRADGLNELPSVRPKAGGRFELLTGSNRTAALRLLGWKESDFEVRNIDDNDAARLVFFDNYFHKPLADYEKFRGFATLISIGETRGAAPSLRSLAKEAGMSSSQMARLFAFAKLPDQARAILDEHPSILQANAAESLIRYCDADKQHLVVEAIEQLRDGKLTQGRAASWIDHRLTARPPKSERTLTSRGGKQFAKLERIGQRVTLKIATGVNSQEIEEAVFTLLQQHAEKGEPS